MCALDDVLLGDAEGMEFAGHELLEEIARGGMGVVYRARQRQPAREVALKTLLGAGLSSDSARERFRIEARAMAGLDHPGILPIHLFGEQDGVPFFTMKLATGGSLAARRERFAGNWSAIAGLIASVAEAVQFAHERGVLHRDLKPANILFDENDHAYVADFGMAKLLNESAGLTHSIDLLGTPHYLAPEVATGGGGAATTASDIWSLGTILYELLAQRPAFEADSVPSLLRRIAEEEPPPLSERRFGPVPRDLEVIARKALTKVPVRRYSTARELAADLGRWLQGRPIAARPAGGFERAAFWARRNPALAASLGAAAALLAALVNAELRSRGRLERALAETQLREVQLLRKSEEAGRRRASLQTIAALARATSVAELPALRTEMAALLALPEMAPLSEWPVPNISTVGSEVFSADLESYAAAVEGGAFVQFESKSRRELARWMHPGAALAREIFLSPDGARLSVQFAHDHWELLTRDAGAPVQRFASSLCFHPKGDGYFHVRKGDGVWHARFDGREPRRVVPGPLLEEPLAIDATGDKLLVVAGEPMQPRIVRVSDGRTLAALSSIAFRVSAVAWSPDGQSLAIADGSLPHSVAIHDAETGRETARFFDHQMPVRKIQFHPDSGSFATVSDGQRLVWRAVEPQGSYLAIEAGKRALQFSPDGMRLGYSPGDGRLGVLDVAPSEVFRPWQTPGRDLAGAAYTMALSPDGRWAAVASDLSLRVWDAAGRRETDVRAYDVIRPWWCSVAFAPADPARLLWSPLDGGIREARIDHSGKLMNPRKLGGPNSAMLQEFASDGRSLIVIDKEDGANTARLWPEGDPSKARRLGGGVPMVGFRHLPGQQTGISTHFSEPDLWLWNLISGERVRSLGLPEPVASEPSPDGRWLFTSTRRENRIWDARTWKATATWPGRDADRDAWAAAFSSDGSILAKASATGTISLRRPEDGHEYLALVPPQPQRIFQVRFADRDTRLLLLHSSGRIYEWDLAGLRSRLAEAGLAW